MKKIVQSIFVITICSVIFLSSTADVNAAGTPTVVYDGKQKEFTLINVADTDLFPLYKSLIPGDDIEQTIVLKIKNLESATSIYLNAECEEETKDALEGTTIDVYSEGKRVVESKLAFDDILLGKYDKKTTESLTAIIHIPTSYGNEISDQKHNIQWVFKAQEEPEKPGNPKTGDDFKILIFVAVMIATMGIIVAVLKKRKRKA